MRIIFTRFPYESQLGGMETMVLQLAKSLRDKGHNISFVGNCPVLLNLFEENNFQVTKLSLPRSPVTKASLFWFILLYPFILFQMWRVVRGLQKGDGIYMLSLLEKLTLTKMASEKKVSVVWGEHEALQYYDGTWRKWLYNNPFLPRYRRYSDYASVIPVSSTLKKQFEALGDIQHITVIENGVDINYFSLHYKGMVQKGTNQFIVGTVARLKKEKGVQQFLEVALLLLQKNKNYHFMIAGDGPERKSLQTFVQKHDIASHITFVGEVPYHQIRTIYSLFDVSIFLSQEHESFGLTPLESMAMGKPTILTSSFGFLDADARTRLLVIEPHQVDKVAEWVEMLHSDPVARKKIADEGYHFIQKRFSVDYMVKKYEKMFLNPPTKVA